jgi:chemotaxis receptor (MCP) glutamine deamidase CheD
VLQVQRHELRPTVGRQNREMALEVLRAEGFDVAASQLGGPVGFHIDFYTATGEVRLRRLG